MYPVAETQENNEPPDPDGPALVPMGRDWRFLAKLLVGLALGAIVAAFVGWKLQSAAARAGSNLLRPGASVIPPAGPIAPSRD